MCCNYYLFKTKLLSKDQIVLGPANKREIIRDLVTVDNK